MRTLSLSIWAFWGASAFAVDIDNDGLSDIWQQKFGAQALLATADDDGDGYTNGEEATAATDPFDSSDYPKQGGMRAGPGENLKILEFPTKVGKWYQLSESRDLQNFAPVGPLLSGTGQMMHLQLDTQNTSKRATQINHELWANVTGTVKRKKGATQTPQKKRDPARRKMACRNFKLQSHSHQSRDKKNHPPLQIRHQR